MLTCITCVSRHVHAFLETPSGISTQADGAAMPARLQRRFQALADATAERFLSEEGAGCQHQSSMDRSPLRRRATWQLPRPRPHRASMLPVFKPASPDTLVR